MNVRSVVTQKQEATSKISAYLDIGITDEEVQNIKTRIIALDGVKDVEYIPQDEAIKLAGDFHTMLVTGYTEEQLKELYQPYFRITFETIEAQDTIISTLKSLDGVGKHPEDIQVPESAKDSIKVAKTIGIVAVLVMVLLIELSVFLMMNSTKLMLYARRKEISIMKYVGAKDVFVKMPFAIEGIIIATVAVVVVLIIVALCYEPIIGVVGARATYKCLALDEIMGSLRVILLGIGIVIGTLGSTISMNKYLDV